MTEIYLGLMSGTSTDGIDAAVVDLAGGQPRLLFAHSYPWLESLRAQILATVTNHTDISLEKFGRLDAAIGEAFAQAALSAMTAANVSSDQVKAIGSHGQTLFHAPNGPQPFSLQAGDPNRIAELTGITTVADFRRRDVAAGGQGAPLVPAFHRALFHDATTFRAVLNIGGMANLTLLPPDYEAVSGFDTGPGNVLLDSWYQKHHAGHFDKGGRWAASGTCSAGLLEQLLKHPYFTQAPPKSTGREQFCFRWLEQQLRDFGSEIAKADVQRTLLEFSAHTIADALHRFSPDVQQVLVCGGGTRNALLMQRLEELLSPLSVRTTEPYGLHPDWVEATAFAWLAQQSLAGQPGNIPAVTGARHPVILGAVHPGRD